MKIPMKKSAGASMWQAMALGAKVTGKHLTREERNDHFKKLFLREPADATTHALMNQIMFLQLKANEFVGKNVLDLGTNTRDLSNSLESMGAKKCISLTSGKKLGGMKKSVVGAAQELPFKDNSFDTIISHFGGLYYSFGTAFFESFYWNLKALKPGGTIILFPPPDLIQLTALEKVGFKIDYSQIAPRIHAPNKEKTLQALLNYQVEEKATLKDVLEEKREVFKELIKSNKKE